MAKLQPKDPFIALMFSFIFPGLGQMYSGRAKRGLFFALAHLNFILALLLLIFHPTKKLNHNILFPVLLFVLFEISVVLDAYIYTRNLRHPFKKTFVRVVLIPLATIIFVLIFNLNILLAEIVNKVIVLAPKIVSNSMSPVLVKGDWFLVNSIVYFNAAPERGDIVFFEFPKDRRRVVVKRLIAKEGESVEIRGGNIYINSQLVSIPSIANIYYFNGGEYGQINQVIKVPKGQYYVLGDYSERSIDSRFWGFVPRENILGKAYKIVYPFERSGFIYNGGRLPDVNVR